MDSYTETEEKRQPIDQTLPKVNKEDLIDELLKADNLPLYLSGNGKGVAWLAFKNNTAAYKWDCNFSNPLFL